MTCLMRAGGSVPAGTCLALISLALNIIEVYEYGCLNLGDF